MERSATLWHAASPSRWWRVDATVTATGDVSICSGDQHREWYAIILTEHVPQLQSALADGETLPSGLSVLDQLAARFGQRDEERGPFEDITAFLNANAIPFASQSW